jgi:hypothetical protein
MRFIITVLILYLVHSSNSENSILSVNILDKTQQVCSVSHKNWDKLLKKHVDEAGNVDYAAFKKDAGTLTNYLNYLSTKVPSDSWTKKDKLAYYINLYNAATVKLIIDHYPLNSIKDIKSPWDKKWIQLGNAQVSLGHIEHQILRKMSEPRIHFAINCASYSCPKLLNEAYTVALLEEQLEQVTKDFVRDSSRNKLSAESVQLSNIFKWYKKDFMTKGSLIDYLNAYSKVDINTKAKVEFLKYDWRLNESR